MTDREAMDLLGRWLMKRAQAAAVAAVCGAVDGLLDTAAGGAIFNHSTDLSLSLHREAEAIQGEIVAAMTGKDRGRP